MPCFCHSQIHHWTLVAVVFILYEISWWMTNTTLFIFFFILFCVDEKSMDFSFHWIRLIEMPWNRLLQYITCFSPSAFLFSPFYHSFFFFSSLISTLLDLCICQMGLRFVMLFKRVEIMATERNDSEFYWNRKYQTTKSNPNWIESNQNQQNVNRTWIICHNFDPCQRKMQKSNQHVTCSIWCFTSQFWYVSYSTLNDFKYDVEVLLWFVSIRWYFLALAQMSFLLSVQQFQSVW